VNTFHTVADGWGIRSEGPISGTLTLAGTLTFLGPVLDTAGKASGMPLKRIDSTAGVLTIDTLGGGHILIGDAAGTTRIGFNQLSVGGQSDDVISSTGFSSLWIDGDLGNDIINGSDSYDALIGGGGNDTIFGFAGEDTIFAGSGNDYIDAGAQNDRISAGQGNDTVWGGDGNDVIGGGAGNDKLHGGLGNDTIRGRLGDDTIIGGAQCDWMSGRNGAPVPGEVNTFVQRVNDSSSLTSTSTGATFVVGATIAYSTVLGGGLDKIIDFLSGASGDKLDLQGSGELPNSALGRATAAGPSGLVAGTNYFLSVDRSVADTNPGSEMLIIQANGAGAHTLVLQGTGGVFAANNSALLLFDVNSNDLVASNFI
jgi:Ca2+-binding RTX toxin-like protein